MKNPPHVTVVLLRLEEVIIRCRLSRSEIERQVKDKRFPSPVRVSKRAIRFREDEINQWIENLERIEK